MVWGAGVIVSKAFIERPVLREGVIIGGFDRLLPPKALSNRILCFTPVP